MFFKSRTPNEPGSTPKERNKVPLASGIMAMPLLGGAAWGLHRMYGPYGNFIGSGIIGQDPTLLNRERVGELVSLQSLGYSRAATHYPDVNALTNWATKKNIYDLPELPRLVELSWRQAAARSSLTQGSIDTVIRSMRGNVAKDTILAAAMTRAQENGIFDAFARALTRNIGSASKEVGVAIPSFDTNVFKDTGFKKTSFARLTEKRQNFLRRLGKDLSKYGDVGNYEIYERGKTQTAIIPMTFKGPSGRFTKNFVVPFATGGRVALGPDLGTFYTAGGFIDQPGQRPVGIRNFSARRIREVAAEISSLVATSKNIDRSYLNELVNEKMAFLGSSERMQWTQGPVLGPRSALKGLQLSPAGQRLSAMMERHQVNYTGRLDFNTLDALVGQGYYPYTSANALSRGRLFTKNFVEAFLPFGSDYQAQRSPLQWIRDVGPTQAARKWMSNYAGKAGPSYAAPFLATEDYLRTVVGKYGYSAPSIPTLFFPEELLQASANATGVSPMAAEEMIIKRSPTLRKMLETERQLARMSISLEGGSISPEIAEILKDPSKLGMKLKSGSFLGLEAGTGKTLRVPTREFTDTIVAGASIDESGKVLNLQLKQLGDIHTGSKVFGLGGTAKSVVSMQSNKGFRSIAERLGVDASGVEAMIPSTNILKQRGAIKRAVATGIGYVVSSKIASGGFISPEHLSSMNDFLANPLKYLSANELVDEIAMLTHAKHKFGFSSQELGEAGGALYKQTDKLTGFSPEDIAEISRGIFKGEVTPYQDWLEPGVKGSIEPRALRQLVGRGDEFGREAARALIERLDNPSRLVGLQTVHKILDDFRGAQNFSAETLKASEIDMDRLSKGGFYLDLERPLETFGGQSKVYVPTSEELPSAGTYRIKGKMPGEESLVINRRIMGRYKSLFRAVSEGKDAELAASNLITSLTSEHAKYSRAGGKLVGSMVGTGLSATSGVYDSPDDFAYISRVDAKRMLRDLYKSGKIDRATRKSALAAMYEGGLESVIWRNPTIGPYSQQPIRTKISGRLTRGKVMLPTFAEQSVDLGELGSVNYSRSRFYGMGGDVDADAYNIALTLGDEKATSAVASQLDSGRWAEEYKNFQLRAKALSGAIKQNTGLDLGSMSLKAQAKAHAQVKLSTGPVSMALSRLRVATALHSPGTNAQFAELSEILEQTAISGKHGLQAKEDLVSAIKEMTYNPSGISHSALKQQVTNLVGAKNIKSLKDRGLYDIETILENVFKASKSFKGSEAERQYTSYVSKQKSGRVKSMSLSRVLSMIGAAEKGTGDVFGVLGNPVARQLSAQQRTQRAAAQSSEDMLRKINIDSIAEAAGKHKGKLMIAAGAGMAALGLLSLGRSRSISAAELDASPVSMPQQRQSALNEETSEAGHANTLSEGILRVPNPLQLQPRPLQRSLVSIPSQVGVRGQVNEQQFTGSVQRSSGSRVTINRHDNRRLRTPEEVLERIIE